MEVLEIKKGTELKIEGFRDEQVKLSGPTLEGDIYMPIFPYSFNEMYLTEEGRELETVQDWINKGEWKGKCPNTSGDKAVMEGWGPYFTVNYDFQAYAENF